MVERTDGVARAAVAKSHSEPFAEQLAAHLDVDLGRILHIERGRFRDRDGVDVIVRVYLDEIGATDAMSDPMGGLLRRRSAHYSVVIDPELSRRGECDIEGKRIVLREWDEEVLLHECLHSLLHEGNFVEVTSYSEEPTRSVRAVEEPLVQHLSHGLYDMGWRLPEPPSAARGDR